MKIRTGLVLFCAALLSCGTKTNNGETKKAAMQITGTWQLISGTTIEKGDTTVTYYTKNLSFIKIINDTHFAFLEHDLNGRKDSAAAFSAGGGRYSLADSIYTEHLEYCSDRQWEGHDFTFTITIKNDTLIQSGVEKVETQGSTG